MNLRRLTIVNSLLHTKIKYKSVDTNFEMILFLVVKSRNYMLEKT